LIPSNRIAPVAASGLGTLNALAPGRIDFGISTGFTARRTLGLGPVRLADMEEYIRVVRGLLAGETVDWIFEGERRKIRFLDPNSGAVNLAAPIPLHIAALGPRARRLIAKLGAGWIGTARNLEAARRALGELHAAWRAAGRSSDGLSATATIAGAVLQDGEAYDSPRVKAQVGANATMSLHAEVERHEFRDFGRGGLGPEFAPLIERYHQLYEAYEPADARYLTNHRGHLMYLRPEEHELCTAELIRALTWTAPKHELQERLRGLREAGYSQVGISAGYGHPERLEEWAAVLEGV
jgi:5,10-methylenetetrahydromethanopterin reductase